MPTLSAKLGFKTAEGKLVKIAIAGSEERIGSDPSNNIVLEYGEVSPKHALIRLDGKMFVINDVKSSAGTFVNEVKVEMERILSSGDKIRIGGVTMVYMEEEVTCEDEAAPSRAPHGARFPVNGEEVTREEEVAPAPEPGTTTPRPAVSGAQPAAVTEVRDRIGEHSPTEGGGPAAPAAELSHLFASRLGATSAAEQSFVPSERAARLALDSRSSGTYTGPTVPRQPLPVVAEATANASPCPTSLVERMDVSSRHVPSPDHPIDLQRARENIGERLIRLLGTLRRAKGGTSPDSQLLLMANPRAFEAPVRSEVCARLGLPPVHPTTECFFRELAVDFHRWAQSEATSESALVHLDGERVYLLCRRSKAISDVFEPLPPLDA